MDVTSQLNLEREAGMGENTERQPVEPASAGGGSGVGRAQARGGQEGRYQPPGRMSHRLLSPLPGFQPRQPSDRTRRLLSCTSSPTKYTFFCFPQKTIHPKTTNQRQQITNQIKSPNVLDQCSVAYQKED